MRWRSIPRLYWSRLETTIVPELLAMLGIGIGVALLFASQVAGTSLNGSATRLTDGVLGSSMRLQVMSRSPLGFDRSLVKQVRRLPGVHAATAVLELQANAIGPSGERSVELIGAEPNAAKLGSAAVKRFSDAQLAKLEALALPEGVASVLGVGQLQPLTIEVAGQEHRALVGLEVRRRDNAVIASSPLVVAPLRYADRLAGLSEKVSRIYVSTSAQRQATVAAELRRLVGGTLNVRPATFDVTLFSRAAAPIDQSTQLFSAISALVGLLFAFYAMLLTVPHRRGLIHDLRLDGYTAAEVGRVLLFDALVLGALSALVGLGLGELLSRSLFQVKPGYLAYAFPIGSQRIVTPATIVLAVCAAIAMALIGVFAPLREVFGPFRGRPEAAQPHPSPARRATLAVGIACLVLTTAVLLFAPQLALLGMASLTVALLLSLPGLFDGALHLFARLCESLRSMAASIAAVELRDNASRVRCLAIAATGAIAVFGSVSIGGAHENLQKGLDESAHAVSSFAQVWVTPRGRYDLFTTAPISTDATTTEAKLRRLSGVASVAPYRGSFLDLGSRRIWVLAPPASSSELISPTQLIRGNPPTASAELRNGGWAVVSQAVAGKLRLSVGSYFHLPTPVPSTLRVAAIGTNLGWPTGAILMNASDYAHAWGSIAPSAYALTPSPGVSPSQVSREAQAALGKASGLAVETASRREARERRASRSGLAQLSEISAMVLIAAILAMAVAMTTVLWQRRPHLAHLQVDGFNRGTLLRALLIETALLLGVGCCAGAVFGIYGQLLLSHALASVTGFPVVVSVGARVALFSFVLVTAIAAAIVAIPGFFASRVRPAIVFED